ncbi:HAD-superfamily hydrolase [Martensiomyces pterosporus]|nr:HAD-superfamily hydrolase [Martensiomyces pterosporus]
MNAARRLPNIRLVTFDLFDTLYTPAEPIGRTYARPLWRHGIDVQEEAVGTAFSRAFKQIHGEYPNYGHSSGMASKQWWAMVIEKTWSYAGINIKDHRDLPRERDAMIERFNTAEGYRMFPEVLKVLKYLRRKGIKLGVVSNMDEGGENVLKDMGIREYFDFVLKSITVGVEKPDPRIFRCALDAVGIPAYDTLHVGDNVRLDYEAAKRVGMEALVVDRSGQGETGEHPERYISSLEGLFQYI